MVLAPSETTTGAGEIAEQGVPDHAQSGAVVQRECLLGQALLQLVLGCCRLQASSTIKFLAVREAYLLVGMAYPWMRCK